MKPIKMWRVEYPIDSNQRGTLAICRGDGGELASVFVRDGTSEKETTIIESHHRDGNTITTFGPGGPLNYRRLSPIPITDGTERVSVVVMSASVNPRAARR